MEDGLILQTLQVQYSKLIESYTTEKVDPTDDEHTQHFTKEISLRKTDSNEENSVNLKSGSISLRKTDSNEEISVNLKSGSNSISQKDSNSINASNINGKSTVAVKKYQRKKSFDQDFDITKNQLPKIKKKTSADASKLVPTNSLDDYLQKTKVATSSKGKDKGHDILKSTSMQHILPPIDGNTESNAVAKFPLVVNKSANMILVEKTDIQFENNISSPPSSTDTWDSVTQQPFCNICQMAFKSIAFLERHNKFSELHKSNQNKESKLSIVTSNDMVDNNIDSVGIARSPLKRSENKNIIAEQIEGAHYKLLYNGSKLFWRSQRTVNIIINTLICHNNK